MTSCFIGVFEGDKGLLRHREHRGHRGILFVEVVEGFGGVFLWKFLHAAVAEEGVGAGHRGEGFGVSRGGGMEEVADEGGGEA